MNLDGYTIFLVRGVCLVYLWEKVFNSAVVAGFMKGLLGT